MGQLIFQCHRGALQQTYYPLNNYYLKRVLGFENPTNFFIASFAIAKTMKKSFCLMGRVEKDGGFLRFLILAVLVVVLSVQVVLVCFNENSKF